MIRDAPSVVCAPDTLEAPCKPALPDHFSYSAMTGFHDCPRKWSYSHLIKAPREFVSSSLLLGGAIHTALEAVHLMRLSNQPASVDEAVGVFRDHWDMESEGREIRFNKGEDRALLHGVAREMIRLYVEECLPQMGQILGIEESVRVEIPGMSVPVVGRIDTLVEAPDALLVVDAKTSKAAFKNEKVPQATSQLALYASALGPLAAQFGKPVRGRLNVFRKLKKPRIETVDIDLSAADLSGVHRRLRDTWTLVRAAHASESYPANPSWMCRQCPYQARCTSDTADGI